MHHLQPVASASIPGEVLQPLLLLLPLLLLRTGHNA